MPKDSAQAFLGPSRASGCLSRNIVSLIILGATVTTFVGIFAAAVKDDFVLKESHCFTALNMTVFIYVHSKFGCPFLFVESMDPHNFFATTFRTTPTDDSGVFNVIRKLAECGSKSYPANDLFTEMKKRSVATLFDSMSSDEWTAFRLSTTNEVDFFNLLRVQLDAAFHPLYASNELTEPFVHYKHNSAVISAREEVAEAVTKLDTVLRRQIKSMLYDMPLGNDLFGTLESVQGITARHVQDIHAKYYHPSNALFFYYGSVSRRLILREVTRAISGFHVISEADWERNNEVVLWNTRRGRSLEWIVDEKSVGPGVASVLAWVAGDLNNVSSVVDLEFISILLMDTAASPLYNGLIKNGMGERFVTTGYFQSMRRPYFAIGVDGFDPRTDYTKIVGDLLHDVISRGFEPNQIWKLLNTHDIRKRQVVSSQGRKFWELIIGSWIHGVDPICMLDTSWEIERLQRLLAVQPKYFELVMKRDIMNNQHCLALTMKGVPGKNVIPEVPLSLLIRFDTEAYNAKGTESLPSLSVSDLVSPAQTHVVERHDKYILVEAHMNRIVRIDIKCELPMNDACLVDLPFLVAVLPRLGSDDGDGADFIVDELQTEGLKCRVEVKATKTRLCLVVSGSALAQKIESMFSLIEKMLLHSGVVENCVVSEVLSEIANGASTTVENACRRLVINYAMSGFTPTLCLREVVHGLTAIREVARAVEKMRWKETGTKIGYIYNNVLKKSRFTGAIHCENSDRALTEPFMKTLLSRLNVYRESDNVVSPKSSPVIQEVSRRDRCLFINKRMTNFVTVIALSDVCETTRDTCICDVLRVLTLIHHTAGPDIGSIQADFDRVNGIITFVVNETTPSLAVKAIQQHIQAVIDSPPTAGDLERAIIRVIAELDSPKSPSERSMNDFLYNTSAESDESYRAAVMLVTAEDIMHKSKNLQSARKRCISMGPRHDKNLDGDFEVIDITSLGNWQTRGSKS